MELQEEEEEGKAGCFLLLPPLTGQRSTCTYLPDPYSRTCDYPYRLQKLREGGILRLSSSTTWLLTATISSPCIQYLLSSHKITDNTEYQTFSPSFHKGQSQAKQAKNRRSASPKYNKKNWAQPRHRSYNIPSHPTVPPPTPLLSSPTKKGIFFSETGKGKTLACMQGWKKTATSLALSRCVGINGLPYLTLRCLALPYQVGTYLCV